MTISDIGNSNILHTCMLDGSAHGWCVCPSISTTYHKYKVWRKTINECMTTKVFRVLYNYVMNCVKCNAIKHRDTYIIINICVEIPSSAGTCNTAVAGSLDVRLFTKISITKLKWVVLHLVQQCTYKAVNVAVMAWNYWHDFRQHISITAIHVCVKRN